MLTAASVWRKEMAQCLAAEFNSQGFDIKTEERTDDTPFEYEIRNNLSREVLGIEYTPLEKSWVDMANSLIASGYIQRPAQ